MPFVTLPTTKHTLHYTDFPPSSSTTRSTALTLVFVHGLGSTQNYYLSVVLGLVERGYRCILFDNWLAGRSYPTDRSGEKGETSVEAIGQDVLGLMGELGVDRAVVVGYSMGGMLPTHLASTHPDKVVAGICVGPVHPSESVAEVFKKRVPVVSEGGMETMANQVPYLATGSKAKPVHKAFIREMLLSQTPAGYIANCKAIEHATPPEYAKVTCPVLIIAGDEDKSAPLEGCQKIYGSLGTEEGTKRLEVLKGVGHWHCVEAADEVEGLIGEFCEGL